MDRISFSATTTAGPRTPDFAPVPEVKHPGSKRDGSAFSSNSQIHWTLAKKYHRIHIMPCGDLPLKSKVVLVTGGGSGINLSFVKLAVQREARGVIIGDLKLTPEAEKFVQTNSTKVVFAKCDVTRRKDLENLIKVAADRFGDVPDVYIAGAGVFEPAWSNWWDDTEEDRYAELDINVNHALKLSRIAMRVLLGKRKKGVVLITASLAGYQVCICWLRSEQ